MTSQKKIDTPPPDIYSVTRLNREVRAVLEGSFPVIWVQGEISNLAQPASGHIYFSLKDEYAQVRCALFQARKRELRCKPENGMLVLARARVGMYEPRGEFQLIVEHLEEAGLGLLQRAFEELKQRLFKEGLFDEQHKRPVPRLPRSIGVLTSPTGAAVRDILNVLRRRFPLARVIVYPTAVQGEGAVDQIISMLRTAERRNECEVIILARGGGSLEDLQAFNSEKLARAIFDCTLPVVTGIGHEIDFTIADFVADRRAPTPSAAAELVSPDQRELQLLLGQRRTGLGRIMAAGVQMRHRHLEHLRRRLPEPRRILQQLAQGLDDLNQRRQRALRLIFVEKQGRLRQAAALLAGQSPARVLVQYRGRCRQLDQTLLRLMKTSIRFAGQRLEQLALHLHALSPLATLSRGYAIVQHRNGDIVRAAGELSLGEEIRARFASGHADCAVTAITPGEKDS